MKYGLPEEEIKKLEIKKNGKYLCLACYQEGKPIEDSYFDCIKFPHLHYKHPELKDDYKTVVKAYMAVYHITSKNKNEYMGTFKRTGKSKKEKESWEMIKSEGIGNWSQRKLASTALKLEAIADEYIGMANIHKKANRTAEFMDCMEKARQCMDTVGKLVKPTAPSRSKIKNEEGKGEIIPKADRKQMGLLMDLAKKIKEDSEMDTSKMEGAWHEPVAESA